MDVRGDESTFERIRLLFHFVSLGYLLIYTKGRI